MPAPPKYLIQRLPPEILTIIFLHCIPFSRAQAYPRVHFSVAPLLLTRVCRQWKEIALDIGDLWTSLDVQIPNSRDRHARSFWELRLQLLKEWLSYAGERPLKIRLTEERDWDVEEVADFTVFDPFLDVLAQHSHQWQDVAMKLVRERMDALKRLSKRDFPLLERFQFDERIFASMDEDEIEDWEGSFTFLERAPRLLALQFDGIHHPNLVPYMTRLDLSKLQKLRLMSEGSWVPRPGYIHSFLTKCTDLVDLTLHLTYSWGDPYIDHIWDNTPTPPFHITLPHLRDLVLQVDQVERLGGCGSMDIINMLITPQLTSLRLICAHSQTIHSLPDFFVRSNPALKMLSLNYSPTRDTVDGLSADILSTLRLCPDLESLMLSLKPPPDASIDEQEVELKVTNPILSHLTDDEGTDGPLCTQLQYLSFRDTFGKDTKRIPPMLSSLVSFRINPPLGVRRLTSLSVSSYAEIVIDPDLPLPVQDDTQYKATIRGWKAAGLRVSVTIGPEYGHLVHLD